MARSQEFTDSEWVKAADLEHKCQVLAEAYLFGDDFASKRHGVSSQTLRRWRRAVDTDDVQGRMVKLAMHDVRNRREEIYQQEAIVRACKAVTDALDTVDMTSWKSHDILKLGELVNTLTEAALQTRIFNVKIAQQALESGERARRALSADGTITAELVDDTSDDVDP